MIDDSFAILRQQMVQVIEIYAYQSRQRTGKTSLDARVLAIIGEIPRQEFVPYEVRNYAYLDGPLPIGFEKTISQPFMVALMTDLLDIREGDIVLEVGTGLGYHTAIMAALAREVYSVEIIEELAAQAERNLNGVGCTNIRFSLGDGARGWPDYAPFDKIMVASAPQLLPTGLIDQLKPGGRMVIPAGISGAQQLMVVEKKKDGHLLTEEILPVNFSPMEISN